MLSYHRSYKLLVSYSLIAMSKPSAKLHGSQGTGCSLVIWCLATTPMLVSPKVLHDDEKKVLFFLAPYPFCLRADPSGSGKQLLNLE